MFLQLLSDKNLPEQVHQYVSKVNKIAIENREDNYNFNPRGVLGLGPSRPYYFVPEDIVRGSIRNGFHRNEKSLHATQKMNGYEPYLEYPGFQCANRKFRVRDLVRLYFRTT